MKFLLITTPAKELFSINSYTDVVSYYIQKYFNNLDINYDTFQMKSRKEASDEELIEIFTNLDVSQYDCVLALGLRYFTTIPEECGLLLRKKTFVAQLHDGSLLDSKVVDLTLTTRDDSYAYPENSPANRHLRHHKHNKFIGWAADKDLFTPRQFPYEFRILVDHTIYDISQPDRTTDILIKIREFVNSDIWRKKYKNIKIRMIVDFEIIDIDVNNIEIRPYSRKGVSYLDIANELCQTDVYFVTHGESIGLNALEASMAGALVAVPKGYIPESLLKTIHHFEFERTLNWEELLSNVNHGVSRKMALQNDWENVTKRIINILEESVNKNSIVTCQVHDSSTELKLSLNSDVCESDFSSEDAFDDVTNDSEHEEMSEIINRHSQKLFNKNVVFLEAASPKYLVICFTAMHKNRYDRISFFLDDPVRNDTSFLFLQDEDFHYYVGSNIRDDFNIYRKIIEFFVTKGGFLKKNTFTLGSSMGGYAAILYALEFSYGNAIVAVPQSDRESASKHQFSNWTRAISACGDKWRDLHQLILQKDKVPNIYLEYGKYPADKEAAEKIIQSLAQKKSLYIARQTDILKHDLLFEKENILQIIEFFKKFKN